MSRERKFLVVDSSAEDRRVVLNYLKEGPWPDLVISEASTGTEGAACFEVLQPHCVLVHNVLPDMDGIEMVERIRYYPDGEFTPIVMLAREGSAHSAVNAMRAGVSDYISMAALTRRVLNRSVSNAIEKTELRRMIHVHRLRLESMYGDLRRRNAEVRAFYHTVSHELSTPLTIVTEYVAMLLEGVGGDVTPTQSELLRTAAAACDRMVGHVAALTDVDDLSRGDTGVDMGPIRINRVIESAIQMMADQATERGVTVTFQACDEPLMVIGLAGRTRQVVSNLLDNAIRYTPPGGSVEVSAARSPDGGTVRVEVSDTGPGLSKHEQSRVFDRLYQGLTDDDAQIHGGLGLGLSLCRDIVEMQGGQLSVDSQVGLGSKFYFTIPECVDSTERVLALEGVT